MAGKADIPRRIEKGDRLVVIKYEAAFANPRVGVGDIRTVRSASAKLIVWDCPDKDIYGGRTELDKTVTVGWHNDITFTVSYEDGPRVMLQIVRNPSKS